MSRKKHPDYEAQLANLRKWLAPGDTVYTILRHVSSSGMSRDISLVTLSTDEKGAPFIRHLDYSAGIVLGYTRQTRREGLRVGGCGMDMGFHLVYSLGEMLWPNGTDKPHGRRNGEPDSAGGYALRHSWL